MPTSCCPLQGANRFNFLESPRWKFKRWKLDQFLRYRAFRSLPFCGTAKSIQPLRRIASLGHITRAALARLGCRLVCRGLIELSVCGINYNCQFSFCDSVFGAARFSPTLHQGFGPHVSAGPSATPRVGGCLGPTMNHLPAFGLHLLWLLGYAFGIRLLFRGWDAVEMAR